MTQAEMLMDLSRTLGRLEEGQSSIESLIASNHHEAEKYWDSLGAELRNVKHEQRNQEQINSATTSAITSLSTDIKASTTHLSTIDMRLTTVEHLGYKITAWATIGTTIAVVVVQVIIHFGSAVVKKIFG